MGLPYAKRVQGTPFQKKCPLLQKKRVLKIRNLSSKIRSFPLHSQSQAMPHFKILLNFVKDWLRLDAN
jgi:hypothetical protein